VRRFLLVRATTLSAVLVALSACYTYTALPPSGARIGERVRVRVSGGEAERLEQVVLVRDRSVEGELVEQADSNIALAVPLVGASTDGPSFSQQAQQRIVILRADVQGVEVRRVDKLRTSVLIGATIVAVAAVAAAKGTTLLGSNGPGNGPNENRAPRGNLALIWRVSIPPLPGAVHPRSAARNR
jgi:hypothetical protein